MKVLLLSDTYSEHTEKWALGLADSGIQVGLFSFNKASYEWHNHPGITVFFEPEQKINAESTLTKLSYLKYVRILRKIIKHFNPDILHAHYATSYGLVGALTGFKPFVLSVWGADVYDFPKRSGLHRKILQYNLRKASLILSTSEVMKQEVARYTKKDVIVTPFGVDLSKFTNQSAAKKAPGVIYVGTIKPIEEKYGIVYILDAARLLIDRHPDKQFLFYLIGPGNDLDYYSAMVIQKGLGNHVVITGRIPFSEIVEYHNLLDVFLNVSIDDSESFGVAAVEAMACEKPVVVSDVGGLMEVVNQGEYGLVVPKRDAEAIAGAIEKITENPEHYRELGKKAREHVLKHYDWQNNLEQMKALYHKLKSEHEKTVL